MRLSRLRDQLRSSLWLAPAIFGAIAVVASIGLVRLDRRLGETVVGFGGGPDSARALLSTIAASTLTFAGLVFSITVLALQLASGQFSPRVLRTFLRDRSSKVTLGIAIGTFTYALLVMQSVRSETTAGGSFVPPLAVSAALLFALIAIGAFIQYINHISQSIQASRILDAVAEETGEAINRLAEREPGASPPPPPNWVYEGAARQDGVVVAIAEEKMVEIASASSCLIEVVPSVGDWVVEGMPLFRTSVHLSEEHSTSVDDAIQLARGRTMQQDVAFGIRQMVDIADKALSPGINDPTTAVEAIHRIHAALRRLSMTALGSRWIADDDSPARVRINEPTWPDLVSLAFDEIRLDGSGSLQVSRRVRAALDDLDSVVAGERKGPIERARRLLDASDARSFDDPDDLALAGVADPQGMRSRGASDRGLSPPS